MENNIKTFSNAKIISVCHSSQTNLTRHKMQKGKCLKSKTASLLDISHFANKLFSSLFENVVWIWKFLWKTSIASVRLVSITSQLTFITCWHAIRRENGRKPFFFIWTKKNVRFGRFIRRKIYFLEMYSFEIRSK